MYNLFLFTFKYTLDRNVVKEVMVATTWLYLCDLYDVLIFCIVVFRWLRMYFLNVGSDLYVMFLVGLKLFNTFIKKRIVFLSLRYVSFVCLMMFILMFILFV